MKTYLGNDAEALRSIAPGLMALESPTWIQVAFLVWLAALYLMHRHDVKKFHAGS